MANALTWVIFIIVAVAIPAFVFADLSVHCECNNNTDTSDTFECECENRFSNGSTCYYTFINGSCVANKTCQFLAHFYQECEAESMCYTISDGQVVCICNSDESHVTHHCQSGNESACVVPCNSDNDIEYVCSCGSRITCVGNGTTYNNCSLCSSDGSCKYNTSINDTECFCGLTCANGIHGNWTKWADWDDVPCNVTCGNGTKQRTRNCTNPEPQYGGDYCTGDPHETISCFDQPCPIHGNWSEWANWADVLCSVTCGNGTKRRTRNCTNPEPQYGGDNCIGDPHETKSCSYELCPIHGNWSEWVNWAEVLCSVTCGNGTKRRTRNCINPEPQYGGDNCTGITNETISCPYKPCPIHGNWSSWGNWSNCVNTTDNGGGYKLRNRTCTNPAPYAGGNDCSGDAEQREVCPTHGNWSSWGDWSDCVDTTNNGGGHKMQSRTCTNPAPNAGGNDCSGNSTRTMECPTHGNWSPWGDWGACVDITNNGGYRIRSRNCANPAPKAGGNNCSGNSTTRGECPTHGNWSSWGNWGDCVDTKDFGGGYKLRKRNCTNPAPKAGGENCSGDATEKKDCPTHGKWSVWKEWSNCVVGHKMRTRTCTDPAPNAGGNNCSGDAEQREICFSNISSWECNVTCGVGVETRYCYNRSLCNGDSIQTRPCNITNCPVDGNFTNWSEWSRCSSTCGTGTSTRTRTCIPPQNNGLDCSGLTNDIKYCSNPSLCEGEENLSIWSDWSKCNVTCLVGERNRTRHCLNDNCSDELSRFQAELCYAGPCPVDGGYGFWTPWSSCPGHCGSGLVNRTRDCNRPVPANGGLYCHGDETEVIGCSHDGECADEGGFSIWSSWSHCSKTCGQGVELRTRTCKVNEKDQFCNGSNTQEKRCYIKDCPVNGEWSSWNEWSRCSASCGSGKKSRRRTCSNPAPLHGGLECYGNSVEETLCVLPEACPGDEDYKQWGSWSPCNATCDHGMKERKRECTYIEDYPPLLNDGTRCQNEVTQYMDCYERICPINGDFNEWSFWSTCSVTCGSGSKRRTRTCTFPEPMYGGRDCVGALHEEQNCTVSTSCPGDELLTSWTAWSDCSSHCEGSKNRSRECVTGNNCTAIVMTQDCNTDVCPVNGHWAEWTTWTTCDEDCGHQKETRYRTCTNPKPRSTGSLCPGHSTEEATCSSYDFEHCPGYEIIHGGWSDWTWWVPCTKSCGTGHATRYRTCTMPAPRHGGNNCTGAPEEFEICNDHPCPVDGNFTEWTSWTVCSKSCAGGDRTRQRSCTNPSPLHNGKDCSGKDKQSESCNVHPCPVHGNFSAWSDLSFCDLPCGGGIQRRTRTCTAPAPNHGGRPCSCDNTEGYFSLPGCNDSVEVITKCNDFTCPPVTVSLTMCFKTIQESIKKTENSWKFYVSDYIKDGYNDENKPRSIDPQCSDDQDGDFCCNVDVYFNSSNDDELVVLQNIADNLPISQFKSMKANVFKAPDVQFEATVMSSTSIHLNWTVSLSDMSGVMVFYKEKIGNSLSFERIRLPKTSNEHTLKDLKKFTTYLIVLSFNTINGSGIPSPQLERTTFEDVPSRPPEPLSVLNIDRNQFYLSWTAVPPEYRHGTLKGYCVRYNSTPSNNKSLDVLEIGHWIRDLQPYREYFITVAAKTSPGCGVYSKTLIVKTLEDKPYAPPTEIIGRTVNSTTIHLEWQPIPKEQRNGIIIEYEITCNSGFPTFKVDGGSLQAYLSGLHPQTVYSIVIQGATSRGAGQPSSAVNATTAEGVPEICPTISASATGSSTIHLRWTTTQITHGTLLGYNVKYREIGMKSYPKIVEHDTHTTEMFLEKLFFYWDYEIEVCGRTKAGMGKGVPITVRTQEEIPGEAPRDLTGISETSTSIMIKWDEVFGNWVHGVLLGYNLTVRETDNWSNVVFQSVLTPEYRERFISGLKKYTNYTAWIRAVNSKGHGKESEPHIQITGEDAPEAGPKDIVATNQSHVSTIWLEWTRIPREYSNGIIRGYYVEYTAVILNSLVVPVEDRQNKTFRVRGDRYATILRDLIPGSTYHIQMYGYTVKNGTKSKIIVAETCRCPKYLLTNWWEISPYTTGSGLAIDGLFPEVLHMIEDMCGICANGHGKTELCYTESCDKRTRKRRSTHGNEKHGLQDVLDHINDNVDLSFPVPGNKYKTMHGGMYSYVSVVETPGAAYFSVKHVPTTSEVFMKAAIDCSPLVFFILVLSALAGIIIWLLERFKNPDYFPHSFVKGCIEGLWWAFISATTVGYGDRRPITVAGRLFAITWILTGYVIIAIFTGIMVNSVTLVVVKQETSIYGSKVAVVQNSTEHGKALRLNSKVYTFPNIESVLLAMKKEEVSGALVDMYVTATKKEFFDDSNIQLNRFIEYPSGQGIVLSGRMKHSAPMINTYLEKEREKLLGIIERNTDVVTRKEKKVIEEAKEKSSGLFDPNSSSFRSVMIINVVMLTVSVIAGLLWQYQYSCRLKRIMAERESTPSYAVFSNLKTKAKPQVEVHFQELLAKLKKVKERQWQDLMTLTRMKKQAGMKSWTTSSLNRIRKMATSVHPEIQSQHNFALEIMDNESRQPSERVQEDSFV